MLQSVPDLSVKLSGRVPGLFDAASKTLAQDGTVADFVAALVSATPAPSSPGPSPAPSPAPAPVSLPPGPSGPGGSG